MIYLKMKASLLFIILYARLAYTQVSGCQEDVDCDSNSYCDLSSYQCHPCLNCQELKREPGTVVSGCIKSVVRCGGCIDGLVEDPSGDVTAPCVPPSESTGSTPPYVWVVVAVALLVIVMLAICVYVYKHTDTLKLITSSRTWVRPSAPSAETPPPPPYNPTSPTSPPSPSQDLYLHHHSGESAHPFIKVNENGAPHNDRVRDSSQAARVFNNPHYVRGPELPPSYDAAWKADVATPTPENNDENTMESLWTPSQDDTSIYNTPAHSEPSPSTVPVSDLSSLLSEARETRLVRPPRPDIQDMQPTPSKLICVRQDTNNNGNSRNKDAGEGPSSSTVPSVTFNITVQQHNDLKLIST